MRAELIRADDPRWRRVLERTTHDVYQLPEYAMAAARVEGGEPGAFLVEEGDDAWIAPLLIRTLPAGLDAPSGWRDAVSPYGYSSPVATRPGDSGGMAQALLAMSAAAREAGLISAFLRLHPHLPLALETASRIGRLEQNGFTVHLDLSVSPDKYWTQVRSNHRRGIERLERTGFSVEMDAWERYDDFIRVYHETMARHSAGAFYHFPTSYFKDLRILLGDRVHLCTVHSPSGDVTSGGLFFTSGRIVQYHLGGTADAYVQHATSKLMFHRVRGWAAGRGDRIFCLGGGLGGREDSLFHFKAGFSPLRAPFHTLRLVFDDAKYVLLESRRGAPAGESDFFPAYRRGTG